MLKDENNCLFGVAIGNDDSKLQLSVVINLI